MIGFDKVMGKAAAQGTARYAHGVDEDGYAQLVGPRCCPLHAFHAVVGNISQVHGQYGSQRHEFRRFLRVRRHVGTGTDGQH